MERSSTLPIEILRYLSSQLGPEELRTMSRVNIRLRETLAGLYLSRICSQPISIDQARKSIQENNLLPLGRIWREPSFPNVRPITINGQVIIPYGSMVVIREVIFFVEKRTFEVIKQTLDRTTLDFFDYTVRTLYPGITPNEFLDLFTIGNILSERIGCLVRRPTFVIDELNKIIDTFIPAPEDGAVTFGWKRINLWVNNVLIGEPFDIKRTLSPYEIRARITLLRFQVAKRFKPKYFE
jgi:hypothetical protein